MKIYTRLSFFKINETFFEGIRSIASLPQKFRKTIWVIRRSHVICEPIYEGDKVKYEIVRLENQRKIDEKTSH